MTTETKTTDFDTVREDVDTIRIPLVGLNLREARFNPNYRPADAALAALSRIEASRSALVAALEGLLSRYTGGDAESGAIYVTKEIIETAQSALKTP